MELFDAIGINRRCTRKGGGVDLQKVSSILITELRSGLLGPISWETPEMTQLEVATAKAEEEKKRIEKEEAESIRRLKSKKNRR